MHDRHGLACSLSFEETQSTLEYAHRAKNIKNAPQVNQRLTKRRDEGHSVEIEKLRTELNAAREKNGVFLPKERFEDMEETIASQAAQLTDLEQAVKAAEEAPRDEGCRL